jgi:hypothetical protein
MFLNTLDHRSFDTVENNKNSDFYLAVNYHTRCNRFVKKFGHISRNLYVRIISLLFKVLADLCH